MVTMTKISSSLHEYLCSLKNIHIFNTNLNDHWGFFVDIENRPTNSIPILIDKKNKYQKNLRNLMNRQMKSYKSVSNLTEISDIDKETAIFKLDEELELELEEEDLVKRDGNIQINNNNGKYIDEYKRLNYIGNICIFSTIIIIILLF